MSLTPVLGLARCWALVLALALIGVQTAGLAHTLGHHGHDGHEHEEQVCELCLAFQGVQSGLPPGHGFLGVSDGPGPVGRESVLPGPQARHHFNPSRAPPASLVC